MNEGSESINCRLLKHSLERLLVFSSCLSLLLTPPSSSIGGSFFVLDLLALPSPAPFISIFVSISLPPYFCFASSEPLLSQHSKGPLRVRSTTGLEMHSWRYETMLIGDNPVPEGVSFLPRLFPENQIIQSYTDIYIYLLILTV